MEFIQDFIQVHLICKLKGDPMKTEWVMLAIKLKIGFLNNQEDVTLDKWSVLARFWTHLRFYLCPTYLKVSGRSNQNWMIYADGKVKQRLFQQTRGCNFKINDLIWPVFELTRDFIDVYLICKFCEDLIKTELVMLMTKSNRGFFSNQGI